MNCNYSFSQLKPVFWLVDEGNIDYFDYEVGLTDAERHDCLSIEFETTSELQGLYTFTKSINIVLDGYQPDIELAGKRIAVETKEGEVYLVNWEFQALPTYTYRLDNESDTTTYEIEVPENLPTLSCGEMSEITPSSGQNCSYINIGKKTLKLVERKKALYTNCTIETLSTEPIEFESLSNLAFSEAFDGYRFEQTIEFTLPLNAFDNEVAYKLQEFQNNRYLAVIEPNGIVAGIELGLAVATTIKSDGEEGTITVTLTSDENINCHQCDSVTFTPYQDIVWKYVLHTTDNNHYGWVCVDNAPNEDGEAMYIVQEAFYRNGESAHQYKIHEDYQGWYDDLNIVGTFDTQMTFYKDSCYLPDSLQVNYLQSPLTFYVVGKRWQFEVKSTWSNWVATTVPSFVELSQERGTSGRTVVTMTCTGGTSNTTGQGTLLIRNASQAQSFTIVYDYTAPIIVQSNEITYSAQTKTYFCREQVILIERSASNGFTPQVIVAGKKVTIVYPENASENDVTYSFRFQGVKSKKYQDITIIQHPRS